MNAIEYINKFLVNPFTIPDLILFFIPIFVVSLLIEAIVIIKIFNKKYDKSEAMSSIGMGLGASILNIIFKAFYFSLLLLIFKEFRLFNFLSPTGNDFFELSWHVNHWWVWILLFFADDFTFYWFHRVSHTVRFFWTGHVNHHSSQEYNLATALRQGWIEYGIKYIFWFWLPFVGFHPIMVYSIIQLNLAYQFFIHTETVNKLGILEYFLNTPSHHRVHHGSDLEYLDKNYAGILILWDKFFGTFQKEIFKPTYGLTQNIYTKNIFKIAFHEIHSLFSDVNRAKTWKDKLKYFFLAPGWSHEGEDKRTKVLIKKNFSNNHD